MSAAAISIWILLSIGAIAFGVLNAFAGSMSDDPSAGDAAVKLGGYVAIAGILSLIAALVVLVLH